MEDNNGAVNYTGSINITRDLGDSLCNLAIWPTPMKKPDSLLGRDFTYIKASQIPFYCSTLQEGDSIKNEFGDILRYWREGRGKYTLATNDPSEYLSNWFCKWEKI